MPRVRIDNFVRRAQRDVLAMNLRDLAIQRHIAHKLLHARDQGARRRDDHFIKEAVYAGYVRFCFVVLPH